MFDVKVYFIYKDTHALDGHMFSSPIESTYDEACSIESVKIVFIFAALNNLDDFVANTGKK